MGEHALLTKVVLLVSVAVLQMKYVYSKMTTLNPMHRRNTILMYRRNTIPMYRRNTRLNPMHRTNTRIKMKKRMKKIKKKKTKMKKRRKRSLGRAPKGGSSSGRTIIETNEEEDATETDEDSGADI